MTMTATNCAPSAPKRERRPPSRPTEPAKSSFHEAVAYQRRNRIGCFFKKLKHFHQIATTAATGVRTSSSLASTSQAPYGGDLARATADRIHNLG
jgi:transposase